MEIQPLISFTTRSGRSASIRSPKLEDDHALLQFMNTLSSEDTFLRLSGEQQTLEEMQFYLSSDIKSISRGDATKLFCFIDEVLVGVCNIHRDLSFLQRKHHVGTFSLLVAKDFRNDGIGYTLAHHTITQAQQIILGLRMIELVCFATNTPALALYTKLGFQEAGRVPGALFRKGEYIDEVRMFMPLVKTPSKQPLQHVVQDQDKTEKE